MNTRSIMVDGISVVLEDQTAAIVERANQVAAKALQDSASQIAMLTTQLQQANDAVASSTTTHKAALDAKDAELATVKSQLADAQKATSPEKLDELVATRQATFDRAKVILGDGYDFNGKTDVQVRRDTVTAKLGDTAKGWSDDMVRVSFDTLCATAMAAGGGQQQQQQGGGASQQIAQAFDWVGDNAPINPNDKTQAAYAERNKQLADAWKRAPAAV